MRKRRTSGRVTLQDIADYVGVGTMTVSRVMRTPELVSDSVRQKVEQAARALGYTPNQDASAVVNSAGRVTLQDVASHADVSPMTVSRALRDPAQVSEGSLKKINEAIQALGYVPDAAASALASAQHNTVAVFYPFQQDRACARFLHALQDSIGKHQFQLVMACHEYHQHGEAKILQKLLQNRPSALVLFGAPLSTQTLALIKESELVTVNVCGAEAFNADVSLELAFTESAEYLTRKLLEAGYQKIAYIGAHTDNRLQKQQLNGWRKAMLAHYQNADLIRTVPDAPSLQFGRYAMSELLQSHPDMDAVICSHEEIAFGLLAECQRRLLKVPYDLAVACLEGSDDCDHTFPTLTAMRLDYHALGQQVGERLMSMLNNAQTQRPVERIGYTLEWRSST